MISRFAWIGDTILFWLIVVLGLSVASQSSFTTRAPITIALDVIGGMVFLLPPLLFVSAIRYAWLRRHWPDQKGTFSAGRYFAITACMAGANVSLIHMFVPSRVLLIAVALAVALAGLLTVVSPIRSRK